MVKFDEKKKHVVFDIEDFEKACFESPEEIDKELEKIYQSIDKEPPKRSVKDIVEEMGICPRIEKVKELEELREWTKLNEALSEAIDDLDTEELNVKITEEKYLKEKLEERDKIIDKIKELEEDKKIIEQKKERAEEIAEKSRKQKRELEKKYLNIDDTITAKSQKKYDLSRQIVRLKKEIGNFEQRIENLDYRREQNKEEINKYKKKKEELLPRIKEFKKKCPGIDEFLQDYDEMKETREKLSVLDPSPTIDKLEKEKKEIIPDLEFLTERKTEIEKEIGPINKRKKKLLDKIKSVEPKIEEGKKTVSYIEKKLRNLGNLLDKGYEKVKKTEKDIESYKRRIKKGKTKLIPKFRKEIEEIKEKFEERDPPIPIEKLKDPETYEVNIKKIKKEIPFRFSID